MEDASRTSPQPFGDSDWLESMGQLSGNPGWFIVEHNTGGPHDLRPASALLEQELAQEIRRQGIVVWLDRDKSFTTFVDRLAERHAAGTFEHPVVGFRGSFLEMLFALETRGSGYDRNPLLIHMPGFNEEGNARAPRCWSCTRQGHVSARPWTP